MGADFLVGGSGSDVIQGGEGDDIIIGGDGIDVLSGGGADILNDINADWWVGNDTFIFEGLGNTDVVTDFTVSSILSE